MNSCEHASICSSCAWQETSLEEQRQQKAQALKQKLESLSIVIPAPIPYHLPAPAFLRDRVDLSYSEGHYGFYRRSEKTIFPLQQCPQMSPELFSFFLDLKKISLPIKKGSLRLRVSPQGQRGLWLDFSHVDIKNLFAEKTALHALLNAAYVEVGQRRKKLLWDGERFRLQDPQFHPWTRTWDHQGPFPLLSTVASFSQTGDHANRVINQRLQTLLDTTTSQRWIEFGCGNGNLTIPLAGRSRQVLAVEYDKSTLQGFAQCLKAHPELQSRIQLQAGDFQYKQSLDFSGMEGVLVNPPRSGLQNFLRPLQACKNPPRDLIYMSCFLDSFALDAVQIQSAGYQLTQLEIIDQFLYTPHFEILSLWQRRPHKVA